MAKTIFDDGCIIVTARYIQQKKTGGPFFYHRRIPDELRKHFGDKQFIRKSLQTKSPSVAAQKAAKLAAEHDALWQSLRDPGAIESGLTTRETRDGAEALMKHLGVKPGEALGEHWDAYDPLDNHLTERRGEDYVEARWGEYRSDKRLERVLSPAENEAMRLAYANPGEKRHLLSDARDLYLGLHRRGEAKRFNVDTTRAIQHVIDAIGDLPLQTYTRAQARDVVKTIVEAGNKTATVRRKLNSINAVFNKGVREFELKGVENPFAEMDIKGEGEDTESRHPFTREELERVAAACKASDDDKRHIIAIQLDTGARLSEIIGLRRGDVFLEGEVPHIWIRAHPALGHTLKNKHSQRKVPLVGMALWGVQRTSEGSAQGWLFPRYATDGNLKADSASATLNKWLKAQTGADKTTHSFRHAMRDRLRAVEAPQEIQDDIGGWGERTIGQGYGEGHALAAKHKWLSKIILET